MCLREAGLSPSPILVCVFMPEPVPEPNQKGSGQPEPGQRQDRHSGRDSTSLSSQEIIIARPAGTALLLIARPLPKKRRAATAQPKPSQPVGGPPREE